jgi:hypothetical protein
MHDHMSIFTKHNIKCPEIVLGLQSECTATTECGWSLQEREGLRLHCGSRLVLSRECLMLHSHIQRMRSQVCGCVVKWGSKNNQCEDTRLKENRTMSLDLINSPHTTHDHQTMPLQGLLESLHEFGPRSNFYPLCSPCPATKTSWWVFWSLMLQIVSRWIQFFLLCFNELFIHIWVYSLCCITLTQWGSWGAWCHHVEWTRNAYF